MPFAAMWMDLEIVILSEVSQKEKMNNICYHLYVESFFSITNDLFSKQKQIHRHRKQTYGYQRGKGG